MKSIRPWALRSAAVLAALVAMSAPPTRALEWEAVGPDGGAVDGFAQSPSNPDRMYALLTYRGLYRSDDRGANWAAVIPGLATEVRFRAIEVSTTDPDLVLVSPTDGADVLRSTDAGANWTAISLAPGVGSFTFDPFDGTRVLASAGSGALKGIYLSTDSGASWAFSNSGMGSAGPGEIAFDSSNPEHVVVATDVGVSFSTNGGATWQSSAMSGGTSGSISFCESDTDVVWSSAHPGGILRSTNGGASFQSLGPADDCHPSLCESAVVLGSAVDFNEVHCISGGEWNALGDCAFAVQRSTDFGVTWNQRQPYFNEKCDNQRNSGFSRDPEIAQHLFLGMRTFGQDPLRHGFYRSTNNGQDWFARETGLRGVSVFEVEGGASGTMYVRASSKAGLWRRESDDNNWTELNAPLASSGKVTLFAAHDWHDGILYEGGSFPQFDVEPPVFRVSSDFGATWATCLVPQAFLSQYPRVVAADPVSGQTVYLWCDDGFSQSALFRSQNAGILFSEISDDPMPADAVVAWNNPLRLFAISKVAPGGVRLSIDGGVTWSPRDQGLPSDEGVALFLGPFGPGTPELLAVYRTSGAYRSTNNGLAWAAVDLPGYSGEPVVDADWDAASETLFLATEADGVYRSDFGFVTAGLTTTQLTAIEYDRVSGSLYVGTSHASAFRLQSNAGVGVPVLNATPSTLALLARPHPTRGATEFEFTVPSQTARARIVIVDVTGRLVATPFEGKLALGRHFATWNGNSRTGGRVAPGAYFARLEADGFVTSTRITILAD